ncbi:hypothetical protein SAMN05444157_0707 [Frankineae bacterium MT45]|nr:hypothetical protein SAMN05444157_0707 [Frankineae bacterium MT45]
MSLADSGSTGKAGVKTLAIRLEPDLHAQLSLIAQLRASTITDEIRTAIEAHIARAKTAPELVGQADAVLEEIERDAVARRAAIATLFGNQPATPEKPSSSAIPISRGRGAKPSDGKASDS